MIRHYENARNFLLVLGIQEDRIYDIIGEGSNLSDSELFERVRFWLSDPRRRALLIRKTPSKTFTEMTEPEQRYFKRLVKYQNLNWLNELFGVTADRGIKDILRFKNQMEKNEFKLPNSMVNEIMKIIALYER